MTTDKIDRKPAVKAKTGRQRAGHLSGMQVMFAAILAIGLILVLSFSSRITKSQPLRETRENVLKEIEGLREVQATLIAERDFVASDAYVEQWARNEGKMIRLGEVLVVPVPSGVSVQPTPVATPSVPVETTPPEPQPWQLWWALFFDTEPPEL